MAENPPIDPPADLPPADLPKDGFPPLPQVPAPYPVPALIPENMVCLRGPCRYYWHLKTDAQLGNAAGTFESMGIEIPRQHHHKCLLSRAEIVDFEDNCAYECSQWDPFTPRELKQIEKRRRTYKGPK